jgi:hypothetical protein
MMRCSVAALANLGRTLYLQQEELLWLWWAAEAPVAAAALMVMMDQTAKTARYRVAQINLPQ